MNKSEVMVIPRRDVLDGYGPIWEWLLAEKGWNDLPAEKKGGHVVQSYSDGTWDVHFDALDYTACGVYPSELKLAE